MRAVDQVDLDVERGETVAIVGPSGCGKSTLLHLIGGLERPSRGELRLAGQRIDQMGETALARLRRHAVGFVFQAFHLVDELTAVENVELPALLAGTSPRAARRRALELLDQIGLTDRAKHLPSALSGGQCQRVAIARALVGEPEVVLADEPTGNLDSAATIEVLRLFDGLRSAGQTLVIVTHDSRIAATNGPDVVVQVWPPQPGQKPGLASAAARNQLAAMAHDAGVTGSSGPYPTSNPDLRAGGTAVSVFAEGRNMANTGVDHPYLTAGTSVRPGEVVLDRNVADALNVGPGDAVTLGGRSFRVAGVAVTAAQGQTSLPGLVWATRADALSLASRTNPLGYTLNLRLANQSAAAALAFADAHGTGSMFAFPWSQVEQSDNKLITIVQIVMLLGTWLLGLLAVSSVAVLVGGRMADQTRRVGLLKAVGATPRLVAAHGATHGHALVLTPPLWWLALVLPGTLLVVAVLTAIPARIGARRPVAMVLRAE